MVILYARVCYSDIKRPPCRILDNQRELLHTRKDQIRRDEYQRAMGPTGDSSSPTGKTRVAFNRLICLIMPVGIASTWS